jgi:hypothetical protein
MSKISCLAWKKQLVFEFFESFVGTGVTPARAKVVLCEWGLKFKVKRLCTAGCFLFLWILKCLRLLLYYWEMGVSTNCRCGVILLKSVWAFNGLVI